MEAHELHMLRRKARRDDDLQSGPVRLFSEVIDLTIFDECRAKYTTLAEWLGTTPRTIRRWRDRLAEASYLRVKEGPTDRLIPTDPDDKKSDDRTQMSGDADTDIRTHTSGRTQMSGSADTHDRTQTSGPDESVRSAPDTAVRDMRDNIPQAGGPESEGAPTRDGDSGLRDHPAVEAHREAFPAVSRSRKQREQIVRYVDDIEVWRQVLEWWVMNGYRSRSIGRQIQRYHEKKNEQSDKSERGQPANAPAGRGGDWGEYA